MSSQLDQIAVENFQSYIKISSVHPNVDYTECVKFLEKQAKSLDLQFRQLEPVPGKPIVILTCLGSDTTLPSILLNSHMDVVPVYPEKWHYPPFGAVLDEKTGNIYGRGTQDMKSVGCQYLEALRRIKIDKHSLKRTIHVTFVPDEEIGAVDGMKKFVLTDDFKKLNIGFALDEGYSSANKTFHVAYAERNIWALVIHIPGTSGHGSILLNNTAGEKMTALLVKFYKFREGEKKKLTDNPNLTLGDVTTVNLTQVQGGVQSNVIPPEYVITIDCRIPPTVDNVKFESDLKKWCSDIDPAIWIEWKQKEPQIKPTDTNVNSNLFFAAFKSTLVEKLNLSIDLSVFPGGTDGRFLRELQIPVIGFSPINETPVLLHDNDEFLNRDIFLKGIKIYYDLIQAIANV